PQSRHRQEYTDLYRPENCRRRQGQISHRRRRDPDTLPGLDADPCVHTALRRRSSPGKRGGPMFTGIIEEVGTFLSKKSGSCSASVTIAASRILESVHLGDSICVNGVCLTVTSFHSD